MYIQITNRCNMLCAHCAYDCTAEGQDMTMGTFQKALELDTDSVAIGGGEPTIHPKFVNMLFEALGTCSYVWMATNGSQTELSITLANMAKHGVMGCALSLDVYHDEIDSKVIKAFTKTDKPLYGDKSNDQREIRDVTRKEINAGRCDFGSTGCVCPDMTIQPDGTIRGCGCIDAPIFGNVNTKINIPNNWQWGECSHDQKITEE